jgi:hypothetical protein
MKVFISWSGDASRQIATKLYEWLPMVLQSVQPYMSSESIDKGTRWASSIASELEGTGVGIVVLTPDNLRAPWIYFEAGALAKVVGDAKLAPLLCGLKPSDIGTPLSQFQVTIFNKEDVLKLMKSINACAGDEALPDQRLEKMLGALWDDLEKDISPIIAQAISAHGGAPKRKEEDASDILEELLVLSRQQTQALLNPEKSLSKDMVRMIAEVTSEFRMDQPEFERIRAISHHLYTRWNEMNAILSLTPTDDDETRESELSAHRGRIELIVRDLMEAVDGRRWRRRWQLGENALTRNTQIHSGAKSADDLV